MALLYEVSDHIATITINRPDALNSIDLETWHELSEACAKLEADDDVWVGIITGAGGRAFSAGADLKETIPTLIDDPRGNRYDEPDTIMRGQTVTKPLIAAVNGLALGGGLEIVLACDLRIAAEGARFGAPEITLGFIPGWGATQRLARELPWAIASGIVFSGDQIGAETAHQYGLVNDVVPADRLQAAARQLAETLCSRGPLALRAAKRAMREGLDMSLDDGLQLEHDLFDDLAYTEDAKEGVAAFQERRAATFKGR